MDANFPTKSQPCSSIFRPWGMAVPMLQTTGTRSQNKLWYDASWKKKKKKQHGVCHHVRKFRTKIVRRSMLFFSRSNEKQEWRILRFVSTTIIMKRVSALSIRFNRSWPISSNVLDLFTLIPMLSVAVCPRLSLTLSTRSLSLFVIHVMREREKERDVSFFFFCY